MSPGRDLNAFRVRNSLDAGQATIGIRATRCATPIRRYNCSSFRRLLEAAQDLGRTARDSDGRGGKEPQLLKAALKGRTATGEQCIWAILLTIGAVPPAK